MQVADDFSEEYLSVLTYFQGSKKIVEMNSQHSAIQILQIILPYLNTFPSSTLLYNK